MNKIIPSYHSFIHSCYFQVPIALGVNSIKSSFQLFAAALPLWGAYYHSVRPFVTLLPVYNLFALSITEGSLAKKCWLAFRHLLELGTAVRTRNQPEDHETPMYPHAFCNMAESLYDGYHSQSRLELTSQVLRFGSNVVYFGAIWDMQRDSVKVGAALAIQAVYQGFLFGSTSLRLKKWSTLSTFQQLVLSVDLFTKGALCLIRFFQALKARDGEKGQPFPQPKLKPRHSILV